MKGQLRSDGSLGKISGYCFVDATTVIDRLIKDGSDVRLTVRWKFGDELTVVIWNRMAIDWVNEHPNYVYEAFYNGTDELLHLAATEG